jgi:type 1 fimbriae regulatory protein FimB
MERTLETRLKPRRLKRQQEIEMFFRMIRNPRDRALFRLMNNRGLRASEPGRLQLNDYHPGSGTPRLLVRRLKGSITAEHPLVDLEVYALRSWLRVRGDAPAPLFRSRKHRPLNRYQVDRLMRYCCALAGIAVEKAHLHALNTPVPPVWPVYSTPR